MGAPFALLQCSMAWRRSACGTAEAFLKLRLLWWRPSIRLYCLVRWYLSSSWQYPIDSFIHRYSMRSRSGMLAGQSSRVISWSANHLEGILALWAGAKFLLENKISIFIKLVSRWKHKVLQNIPVDGCIDFGLDKTPWTNTADFTAPPNHHWLCKMNTVLQAAWILCLYSLTRDSRPWFPNKTQNVPLSEKKTLDHWPTVQFFFLLCPGKMHLMLFLFQKWLGSPFPEDVWTWWLMIQPQFTPCEALPSVWIGLFWQYSQACGHLCCLYTFLLSNLLLPVLWTIAKSAVFPIIVVSKNKRYPEFLL